MAKSSTNWAAFILELLGSLIFLYVLFGSGGALSLSGPAFAGATASFWAPIFIGAAVVASLALFFSSLAEAAGMAGPKVALMGLETATLAGLTLVALTWTPAGNTLEWYVILGIVLGYLGGFAGMRK